MSVESRQFVTDERTVLEAGLRPALLKLSLYLIYMMIVFVFSLQWTAVLIPLFINQKKLPWAAVQYYRSVQSST
jgi:hypothetical protein